MKRFAAVLLDNTSLTQTNSKMAFCPYAEIKEQVLVELL